MTSGFEPQLVEKVKEKREAIGYIDDVLGLFERQGRPLDHWERFHLCEAVGWAMRGGYAFGEMHASDALTPEADRNIKRYPLPTDEVYTRADLPSLRKVLRIAEAEPVRPFAHLGPIAH